MPKTYSGSCHCGLIKFEVLADIDHLRECNCSICIRRGALIFRVPEENLTVLTPLENAGLYKWGSETAEDYFCPKCGILPFRKPSQLTKAEIEVGKVPFTGWAVNARCLSGLNISEIQVVKIDGASL
ncbi:GFA family protein [Vibrio sp. LaRot3]|uniref:GFA family protein n=1 Tax=Vibrio sp. LaRot3 TaxID=2998829 RepID=UPI0022CE1265|nr:GFA family protein [Vibrio sp. LaRot3]MDA0149551.1 GFA family protein [Vibrio sp. LaRot3]